MHMFSIYRLLKEIYGFDVLKDSILDGFLRRLPNEFHGLGRFQRMQLGIFSF